MYPITHGNYCGAYWSDGKFQRSVINGGKPAIDAWDRACKHHDSQLASGVSPRKANKDFVEDLERIPGISSRLVRGVFNHIQFGEPRFRGDEMMNVRLDPLARAAPHYKELSSEWEPLPQRKPRLRVGATTVAEEKREPLIYEEHRGIDYDKRFVASMNRREKKDLRKAEQYIAKAKSEKKGKEPRMRTRKEAVQKTKEAPVAKATVIANQGPSTSYSKDGSIRVAHRECLGELSSSSSAFAILKTVNINPGLVATFPFLSGIAQRYDKYRIHKLKFYFETESSTAATGSLMMTFDYNALDAAPVTKVAMMAYTGAVKTVPWLDACCVFRTSELLGDLWIRTGGIGTADLKTYDPATFYIAVSGLNGTNSLSGDLWVEYDITLKDPSEANYPVGFYASATSPTTSALFGTYPPTSYTGALPCSWSGNTITFQVSGTYAIYLAATGTNTALTVNGGTGTVVTGETAGSGTYWQTTMIYTVAQGQTLVFSGTNGTVTAVNIAVAPITV